MQCSAVQCNSIHCSAVQCWSVFKLANCAAAYPSPSSVVWEDFLHLTVGNCFTILTQWENYFTVLKQINLIVFTDTTNGNLVSSTIYHSYFNLKKMSPPHAIVFWRSSSVDQPPSLPPSLPQTPSFYIWKRSDAVTYTTFQNSLTSCLKVEEPSKNSFRWRLLAHKRGYKDFFVCQTATHGPEVKRSPLMWGKYCQGFMFRSLTKA